MIFAGHVVGNGQRKPIHGKVAASEHWEKPKTVSKLRAYLGFFNYYSGCHKMYAVYAAPMTAMLKTKKWWKKALVWNDESDRACEGMKQALLSAVGRGSGPRVRPPHRRLRLQNPRSIGASAG